MRDINLLHPEVIKICNSFLKACAQAGYGVKITQTWRTMEEQNELYAQGRTKPGGKVTNCKGTDYQSPHQWGLAFDFCRNESGKGAYDNSDRFFYKVGDIGKSLGLFWGGDFTSMFDGPHLEWRNPDFPKGSTGALKTKYGTPEKYKATWPNYEEEIDMNKYSILKSGDKGDLVKLAQEKLNALGANPKLNADGGFGALTETAVKNMEKANGLTQTGTITATRWAILLGVKYGTPSDWAKEAAASAVLNDVFAGDGSGNFMWQDSITREQLAVLIGKLGLV